MNEDSMLYCLIAFILGWFLSRHIGNGFSVGGQNKGTCLYKGNKNISFFDTNKLMDEKHWTTLCTNFKDKYPCDRVHLKGHEHEKNPSVCLYEYFKFR